MTIDDVPDNDVPAALAYAKEALADGIWDADAAEELLNRQDNQDELLAALTALAAEDGKRAALGSAVKSRRSASDDDPGGERATAMAQAVASRRTQRA